MRELGPFSSDAEAWGALSTTLEVLGGALTSDEREQLACVLPPELAQILRMAHSAPQGSLHDFFLQVAMSEHVRPSVAVEHAEIVCRALGEALPPSAHKRLASALPEVATLFEVIEKRPSYHPPMPPASDPHVQRHSGAASDDPHSETKLSSARGLTQEREGHTLATGQPGASRPSSGRR